jgi:hypothetical protein
VDVFDGEVRLRNLLERIFRSSHRTARQPTQQETSPGRQQGLSDAGYRSGVAARKKQHSLHLAYAQVITAFNAAFTAKTQCTMFCGRNCELKKKGKCELSIWEFEDFTDLKPASSGTVIIN